MNKVIRLLCMVFVVNGLFSESYAEHKIVYLISPPRSLSTAFLRMMEARGDFESIHEPSLSPYWEIYRNSPRNLLVRKDVPHSFEDVKKLITAKAATTNVFVKEISFSVRNFLLKDTDLIKRDNVHFVFLVRNPHHSVLSFYKKQKSKNLKQVPFSNTIGYRDCYELLTHVKQHAVNKPCIIFSEDLYTEPEATIALFCNFLKIPYKVDALAWKNLNEASASISWKEFKTKKLLDTWHSDAIKSSGFHKPTEYKVDANGKPTFEEVANEQHKKTCEYAYTENLTYYQQLLTMQDCFLTSYKPS